MQETPTTQVTIYTDGACKGNPGPGGYGVILVSGKHRKELSGGYRRTTNNRMELLAAIVGLRALRSPCIVTLYTDSKYVADAIEQGWARKWRANGWMRTKTDRALNPDLWEELLALCEQHRVRVVWVRGHAGNEANERCDELAVKAAQQRNLPPDTDYERGPGVK